MMPALGNGIDSSISPARTKITTVNELFGTLIAVLITTPTTGLLQSLARPASP
jgi:hypothetical protein